MTTITVFGGGSWGTALAHLLASEGRDVLLWCRSAEQARAITLTGRNPRHLKTVDLAQIGRASCRERVLERV